MATDHPPNSNSEAIEPTQIFSNDLLVLGQSAYFLGDCTHPNADGFRVLFKELLRRRAFQI